MMPKLVAVLYTSRAHHTSLVPFHSTRRAGRPALQASSVVASAEQASEPRAGLRMVHSTYRKDLRAGVASTADQLAPAILLPSHHASKATAERRQCALRASRAPLVKAVDVPGAVAGPGTLCPRLRDSPAGQQNFHSAVSRSQNVKILQKIAAPGMQRRPAKITICP